MPEIYLIQQWLSSQGVYNVIVEVDRQKWRINFSQGFAPATEADLMYPSVEAPDWLRDSIRSSALIQEGDRND